MRRRRLLPAGAEVYDAFGHSAFFEQFDELCRNRRRIAGRLEHHGVSTDDRRKRHSSHDGASKIPRWNHRANAKRNIGKRVALAWQLHGRLGLRKAQRLTRIVFTKVDGLGNVGIGFGPVLRNLEHQPRHVFELALAHHVSHAE